MGDGHDQDVLPARQRLFTGNGQRRQPTKARILAVRASALTGFPALR